MHYVCNDWFAEMIFFRRRAECTPMGLIMWETVVLEAADLTWDLVRKAVHRVAHHLSRRRKNVQVAGAVEVPEIC